ncbi:response regulator transcription factor [Pseudobdellovibrio exovorus]|uniref:Two-component response regulator n=1 Tax=Pseudobdellovibrio exovorus JSS TaxID=1184267 RepID=M4VRJ4_9BACT|nr:response regulator transcription factor [Pseudobdellovibrio exovorus]AGH95804.1 hypothetical protein A11Q_1588 [Pseudobdellovibrio exovorus JSS]
MSILPTSNSFQNICLIVEDQPQVCNFLTQSMTEAFPELRVIVRSNITAAIEWLKQRTPEMKAQQPLRLGLIDLGLPDGSGVELIRYLKTNEPDTRSVVVTIYDDDQHVFEALAAGASGYILKFESPAHFVEILKRIQKDEPPLSPSIARKMLAHFNTMALTSSSSLEIPEATETKKTPLTAREQETLTLLSRGLTVAEAAGEMKLSPQTVAGYVKIIYQKLQVTNRAEATREAIRLGLG